MLGLLALACASPQVVQTEVRIPDPLGDECIVATMRGETGVVGFREMPTKHGMAYWFQLADPELASRQRPSQLLSQRSVHDGWAIDLAAKFDAKESEGARSRETVLRSQQRMLQQVARQCAGAEIEFGPATVCGRGAEHTLCIQGELRGG